MPPKDLQYVIPLGEIMKLNIYLCSVLGRMAESEGKLSEVILYRLHTQYSLDVFPARLSLQTEIHLNAVCSYDHINCP